MVSPPLPTEANAYFQRYIQLVQSDLTTAFSTQMERMLTLARTWSAADWEYSYAAGKWTRKESFLHIIDTERVFTYRALRIARGDQTPMTGFDQDLFVANSDVSQRTGADLIAEYQAVRQATTVFFQSLPTEIWLRTGVASGSNLSVRAAAYIIAGHELHHINLFLDKYANT